MLEQVDELLAMPEENCGNHPRRHTEPCFPPTATAAASARLVIAELTQLRAWARIVPTCERGFHFEWFPDDDRGPPFIDWRGHRQIWCISIEGDGTVTAGSNLTDDDITIDLGQPSP